MKMKQTALILGLATFGLVSFAQKNKPDPAPANPPPANTEPAKAEPADPAKADPAKADPAKAEPADPAKADPAKADPTKADPAKVDPAKAEPAKTEPAPAEVAAPVPTPVPVQAAPTAPPATPETPATPGTPTPSATPATPAAANPAPAAAGAPETVPLIVIDDVPLTDAIRNLARQSNLNFQFDPRVTAAGPGTNQPNVSIRFENVTAQEALQAVLDNYNLVLVQDPKSKIARVTIKDPKAEDPLFSQTIQLKYSDPTNLVTLVKSTLSPRSSVMGDPRTSQLLVTTTEKEMNGVVILIAKLDTPTKQVLIEARLLETTHNPSTVKGIDWSGTLAAQNFKFGNGRVDLNPPQNGVINGTPSITLNPTVPPVAYAPSAPATFPDGTPRSSSLAQGIFVGNGGLLANTAKGFFPATAFLNADGVSAVLSFLNQDADTEVIATPRAVTLDNQTAKLEVTRAFPVFLITPGSANSPAGASITYTNLGVILSVTPRIAADKNISLRIVPEVSNIDSVDKQTLNGTVNTANIYAIRKIDTRVMIPSGSTLVMGGLINDTKNKQFTKVPILGDLPIIGLAFRKESKSRNKQNLLIFITPTIVEDDAFHVTSSGEEFLNTRIVEKPDVAESAWDSGKPHDWTKPVY